MFERYTKECTKEAKYDYLLASTEGESLHYVENRSSCVQAMAKLDEKYGNLHVIMGLLVDEIKLLPVVRKDDIKAFEHICYRVNEFYERLVIMGRENDAENSYILKEIESKLNYDDHQKWLVTDRYS